jgi:hypothetical protein
MKFSIERTSDKALDTDAPPAPGAVRSGAGKTWHIDISTLEELTTLIDTLEEPLILSRRQGPGSTVAIEIYDDMREEFP